MKPIPICESEFVPKQRGKSAFTKKM